MYILSLVRVVLVMVALDSSRKVTKTDPIVHYRVGGSNAEVLRA